MSYNRAVGRQSGLSGPALDRVGFRRAAALRQSRPMQQYFNAGVNVAYGGSRGDSGLKVGRRKRSWLFGGVNMEGYNLAATQMAYGNVGEAQAQLGDLFNDIMGAVVPGWDQRPAALKQIVVKPDPTKLIQMAQKVAPNAAGQIIGAADKAGLDVMVQTPLGLMPMSQAMAQGLYSNAGIVARAQSALESIPMTVWIGGGAVILLLVSMRKM